MPDQPAPLLAADTDVPRRFAWAHYDNLRGMHVGFSADFRLTRGAEPSLEFRTVENRRKYPVGPSLCFSGDGRLRIEQGRELMVVPHDQWFRVEIPRSSGVCNDRTEEFEKRGLATYAVNVGLACEQRFHALGVPVTVTDRGVRGEVRAGPASNCVFPAAAVPCGCYRWGGLISLQPRTRSVTGVGRGTRLLAIRDAGPYSTRSTGVITSLIEAHQHGNRSNAFVSLLYQHDAQDADEQNARA